MTTDNRGVALATTNFFSTPQQNMIAYVPIRGTWTIYSAVGDLFAWLCAAAMIALCALAIVRPTPHPDPGVKLGTGRDGGPVPWRWAGPAPYRYGVPTTSHGPAGGRIATSLLLAPVRPAGWRATAHLTAGLPLAAAGFAVTAFLGALTVALAPTVWCQRWERSPRWRTARMASAGRNGPGSAPCLASRSRSPSRPPSVPAAGRFQRVFDRALSWRTGRQLGYHLLALPVSVIGTVAVVTMWTVGGALALLPAYAWMMLDRSDAVVEIALTAGGLTLLFSAPWVARGLSTVDVLLARWLLGPRRAETLAHRVQTLTASRAGAIDAADAERRRIERDLHDGTQQRLTALAMNLGIARESLGDSTDPAAKVIAAAHEDAKQTLAELRSFVRGLHPAVLNDRGLDAALSGLASRSPVPVRLHVSVEQRPSATVEAVAYFVVSEALTNVSKHAQATAVEVTAVRTENQLVVTIVDNGRGGAADDDTGSGLRGLRPAGRRRRRPADREKPAGRRHHHHRGAAMRIVIAEDSILLREGLVRLLESRGDEVVDAVGDADALLASVQNDQPDLVIADVRMPPSHTDEGLRAALVLRRQFPELPVLVLSQYVEERYATELLSGPTSGVGYLLKDRVADVSTFIDMLRQVAAGGTVLDPEVVSQILVRHRSDPLDRLTPRESEVLALMAQGRSNSAVASALVISESAVAKHVNSIFTKLDLPLADTDHRRVLAVLRFLRIR